MGDRGRTLAFMDFATQSAVASASDDARARFITRTYLHLAAAIFAFVGLEALLVVSGIAEKIAMLASAGGRFGWLALLVGFMGVSWIADRWARSSTSLGMQYAGLGLYIVGESIIFAPLILLALFMGMEEGDPFGILGEAGLTTLVLFGGLTGVVFLTRKDFSFLRGILMFGGFAAIGLVVISLIFGFSLGLFFSWFMVALAAGYILYQTSGIMLHYRTDQHVAAALGLFASVALLFWYILRIFMDRR